MNTNNNRNMNDDIRNMPLGQNTYDQEFRGGNQSYYSQGMPVSNMNVNLNGNLQQNVDTGFLSKIALVLAVLSFICCCIDWLFSIPAIICAIIALIKNRKDACAWASLVLAGISIALWLILIVTGLMDGIVAGMKGEDSSKESVRISDSPSQSGDINEQESIKISDDTSQSEDVSEQKSISNSVSYEIADTQFYTYEDSIGSLQYLFIMEVENTSDCPIYLDSCKVDIEDNDGKLLKKGDTVSACPRVVQPGEKGYFYNGAFDTILVNSMAGDDDIDASNGINAVPVYTIEKARNEPVYYDLSDLSISKDNWSIQVTGRVVNNTSEDSNSIVVYAIFYDASGKVLCIDRTSVHGLMAGQKDSFEISTMFGAGEINYDDIADYKVIAEESYYQW